MITRILTIGALWNALWWVIIGALVAPLVPGGWLTVLAAMAIGISPLWVLVQRFNGAYPSAWVRVWVFRPFWYLQLGILFTALAGAAAFLVGAPFGAGLRTGRWALLIVAVVLTAAAAAGYAGSRQLRVKRLDARFPDLPVAFDGVRIAQVSDLHVGPHTPRRHLSRVSTAVAQAQPDLVVITGDQVDDYAGDVASFAAAFAGLRAPHGVFAVAGNHDIYAGWPVVRAGLEAIGITVLVNDAVAVDRGSDRLWLAGTGDPAAGGAVAGERHPAPDIGRTLGGIPAGSFVVALAHNPLLWPGLARRGVQLTLSGHTHYGQLAVPMMGWSLASLFLEHAMGWHRRGGSILYINPGTNYWGLPLRIGALPEVTVFTLRRAEGEPQVVTESPVC